MAMTKRGRIIAGIIVAAAILGGAILYKAAGKRTAYETVQVSRGTLVSSVSVTGSVAPKDKISLEPEAVGKVAKVLVDSGSQVKAGDELIALDDADLMAKIAGQNAIIASEQAKLFPSGGAVGAKIKIKDLPVEVIGVAAPTGSVLGIDVDTMTYLPLRTVQKRILGSDKVIEVHVRAIDEAHVPATVFDIARTLRKRHNITDPSKDDFTIQTAVEITDRLQTIASAITYFLGFLAAISLVVGGIGIMNIMLVAVTERIREVGLRKALGAKNGDIMAQFLAEAVALTTAGGVIGGLLGFILAVIAVAVIRAAGLDVPYTVSFTALAGSAAVSALIGVIFGLYPARKAAALDPIEALRFE